MFLDFYRLREQPFGVSPDPRYLYFSPGHREALASLFYGIETGRGFLALIAEPGMGKTSLLFQLLERLKGSIRSAFLFQTQCDSRELLRNLLEALGIDSRERDRKSTRLNSSHLVISYAVFCLKKKKSQRAHAGMLHKRLSTPPALNCNPGPPPPRTCHQNACFLSTPLRTGASSSTLSSISLLW